MPRRPITHPFILPRLRFPGCLRSAVHACPTLPSSTPPAWLCPPGPACLALPAWPVHPACLARLPGPARLARPALAVFASLPSLATLLFTSPPPLAAPVSSLARSFLPFPLGEHRSCA